MDQLRIQERTSLNKIGENNRSEIKSGEQESKSVPSEIKIGERKSKGVRGKAKSDEIKIRVLAAEQERS